MNELPEKDLPPARHRLLKEHLLTEIRREPEQPARARAAWLRPAMAAAAIATAAVVTVAVLPSHGDATGAPSQSGATALLEHIALAAEHSDAVPRTIRDDQFVYIKSRGAYTTQVIGGPAKLDPVHDREIWLSVDGTRWGLLEEDRDGNRHEKLHPDNPKNKTPTNYRALSELPTDPDRMLAWLYRMSARNVEAERPDKDAAAFTLFGDLIRESLMPPEVTAALYRAAAKIPGVTVVREVKDAVGREGVAVTRDGTDGEREELVFDPKTYVFLGERELDADGKLSGSDAILDRAVVDRAGQRP